MSAPRPGELLLRCYPRAWRARYGEELQGLIADMTGGGPVPWRLRADVVLGGARERLRAAGLGGDGAPGDRVRAGTLVVLCAWAVCVVAGAGFQRLSEQWEAVVRPAHRAIAQAAFDVVVIGAVCAAVLVAAGIAVAVPRTVAFLRGGGWRQVRDHVVAAGALTVLAAAATSALVASAHELTAGERNGGDAAYAAGFVASGLMLVACLFAWTTVAIAIARRLDLPRPALRVQARLAGAVAVAIAAITAATGVWWAALGSRAGGEVPQLVGVVALMLLATLASATGARHARRAAAALPA